jgi:hypothetical protein
LEGACVGVVHEVADECVGREARALEGLADDLGLQRLLDAGLDGDAEAGAGEDRVEGVAGPEVEVGAVEDALVLAFERAEEEAEADARVGDVGHREDDAAARREDVVADRDEHRVRVAHVFDDVGEDHDVEAAAAERGGPGRVVEVGGDDLDAAGAGAGGRVGVAFDADAAAAGALGERREEEAVPAAEVEDARVAADLAGDGSTTRSRR